MRHVPPVDFPKYEKKKSTTTGLHIRPQNQGKPLRRPHCACQHCWQRASRFYCNWQMAAVSQETEKALYFVDYVLDLQGEMSAVMYPHLTLKKSRNAIQQNLSLVKPVLTDKDVSSHSGSWQLPQLRHKSEFPIQMQLTINCNYSYRTGKRENAFKMISKNTSWKEESNSVYFHISSQPKTTVVLNHLLPRPFIRERFFPTPGGKDKTLFSCFKQLYFQILKCHPIPETKVHTKIGLSSVSVLLPLIALGPDRKTFVAQIGSQSQVMTFPEMSPPCRKTSARTTLQPSVFCERRMGSQAHQLYYCQLFFHAYRACLVNASVEKHISPRQALGHESIQSYIRYQEPLLLSVRDILKYQLEGLQPNSQHEATSEGSAQDGSVDAEET
ncbi:hypothetical protein EK904_014397, partial [Melospiza melodia maxima]